MTKKQVEIDTTRTRAILFVSERVKVKNKIYCVVK